jgi:hypothetical protein
MHSVSRSLGMHTAYQRRPMSPGLSRWTHLYIVAAALWLPLAVLAQPAGRELLNSERIQANFGTYGIEVLEQDQNVRVSNLYSFPRAGDRTCRTFAVVQYAPSMDPAIRGEHAAIVAGGSIGAVFAASGWEVRKRNLRYGELPATAKLASLMRIATDTQLAEHVYALDVVKGGRTIEYATIVEIHHPAYLRLADLTKIYGPVSVEQSRAVSVSAMRALAAQRAR